MTPTEWTNLLGAITSLVVGCVWPGIVIYLLVSFRPEIRTLLKRMSSVKTPMFEADFGAQQAAEAAASLTVATTSKGNSSGATAPRDVAALVSQTITPTTMGRLPGARILWVDDHPSNNEYERQALQALGVQFTLSLSTEDALQRLRTENYDVIITDLGRGADPNAGFTLLDEAKRLRPTTPVIIYAGARAVQEGEMARQRGAYASTNSPQELFRQVVSALQAKPIAPVRSA